MRQGGQADVLVASGSSTVGSRLIEQGLVLGEGDLDLLIVVAGERRSMRRAVNISERLLRFEVALTENCSRVLVLCHRS